MKPIKLKNNRKNKKLKIKILNNLMNSLKMKHFNNKVSSNNLNLICIRIR